MSNAAGGEIGAAACGRPSSTPWQAVRRSGRLARGRRRAANGFRICVWTETSSADAGSSQTKNSGFDDNARAMEIVCR